MLFVLDGEGRFPAEKERPRKAGPVGPELSWYARLAYNTQWSDARLVCNAQVWSVTLYSHLNAFNLNHRELEDILRGCTTILASGA